MARTTTQTTDKPANDEKQAVRAQSVPVNAHHVVLKIGRVASPDTQYDDKGVMIQPGAVITDELANGWLRRIYIKQGWSVVNVIPRVLEGGTVPLLVLISTIPPDGRKQTDIHVMVRPALGPANIIKTDADVINLINAGFEWRADLSKVVEGDGFTNVLHVFIKYAD